MLSVDVIWELPYSVIGHFFYIFILFVALLLLIILVFKYLYLIVYLRYIRLLNTPKGVIRCEVLVQALKKNMYSRYFLLTPSPPSVGVLLKFIHP